MPQLAGRESGRESGLAGEARDHCFWVHKGRGFLPCVPTDGRAPPKRAPETGVTCSYHLGHGLLMLPLLPPRILCANAGHYPHPPGSLCSTPLPGSRDLGTNSLGEHMMHLRLLQCHASLCRCWLAPHSNYDYHTPPSPQPE